MELVADVGNTAVKLAVYQGNHQVSSISFPHGEDAEMIEWVSSHKPDRVLVASVAELPDQLIGYLNTSSRLLFLDQYTPLPVFNAYSTPETLGKDRLANACGASALFPGEHVLVFDAGTCLKADLVTADRTYLGGSIAPGLTMRFKALHHYCPALPLISVSGESPLTGVSTETSIRSGVLNGMVAEITGLLNSYREAYPGVRAVLTGGDTPVLVNRLQKDIFAVPGLTLHGLHAILSNIP